MITALLCCFVDFLLTLLTLSLNNGDIVCFFYMEVNRCQLVRESCTWVS